MKTPNQQLLEKVRTVAKNWTTEEKRLILISTVQMFAPETVETMFDNLVCDLEDNVEEALR